MTNLSKKYVLKTRLTRADDCNSLPFVLHTVEADKVKNLFFVEHFLKKRNFYIEMKPDKRKNGN